MRRRKVRNTSAVVRHTLGWLMLACLATTLAFVAPPEAQAAKKKRRGADDADYHQPVVKPALNTTHLKKKPKTKGAAVDAAIDPGTIEPTVAAATEPAVAPA